MVFMQSRPIFFHEALHVNKGFLYIYFTSDDLTLQKYNLLLE